MNRWAILGRPSGTVAMETDDPVTSELGFDRRQVPQLYRAIAAARCQPQSLGTLEEYQASDLVDVTFESLKQLAGLGIPDFDSAILPTRSDPAAVGAEGKCERPVAATDQRDGSVATVDIMDRDRVIACDNDEARTVWTEGNQVRKIFALSLERAQGLLRLVQMGRVPKLYNVIVVDGRQVPAVRTER